MSAGGYEVVAARPEHLDVIVSLYAETAEWHVALDPAYYVRFDDEAAAIRDSYDQVLHDTSGEVPTPREFLLTAVLRSVLHWRFLLLLLSRL